MQHIARGNKEEEEEEEGEEEKDDDEEEEEKEKGRKVAYLIVAMFLPLSQQDVAIYWT